MLEAAFERHVAEVEALHSAIELMPLGDLRAELTLLARFGMQTLVRERALRRIVITEGDRFPDLKRRYQERVVDRSYEEVIGFISLKVAAGEFPDCDVEAIAVVMVGALLGYSVEYDVFGRQPAGRRRGPLHRRRRRRRHGPRRGAVNQEGERRDEWSRIERHGTVIRDRPHLPGRRRSAWSRR